MTKGVKRVLQWWSGTTDPYRAPAAALLSGFTRASAYNRQVTAIDLDAIRDDWRAELSKSTDPAATETIGRAYDSALTRDIRVESKAVGLLQVIAIGYAIVALVAGSHETILVLLSLIAVLYLALATLGALQLLRARARQQVLSFHAKDETGGLLQTAVAATSLESASTIYSNWLTGLLLDLQIGFGASVAALILSILGVGR